VTHRKDTAEEQAIALLERVVALSEADRDALPANPGTCDATAPAINDGHVLEQAASHSLSIARLSPSSAAFCACCLSP
jgi:hypothetical protein